MADRSGEKTETQQPQGTESATDRLIREGQKAGNEAVASAQQMVDYMEDQLGYGADPSTSNQASECAVAAEGVRKPLQQATDQASKAESSAEQAMRGLSIREDQGTQQPQEGNTGLLSGAQAAITKGLDALKQAVTGTKEQASAQGESVKEGAAGASQEAQESTEELEEKMKDVMSRAVGSAKEGLRNLEDKNREYTESISGEPNSKEVRDSSKSAWARGIDRVKRALHRTHEVFIGIKAGPEVGFTEEESMVPYSSTEETSRESVSEKAEEAFDCAVDAAKASVSPYIDVGAPSDGAWSESMTVKAQDAVDRAVDYTKETVLGEPSTREPQPPVQPIRRPHAPEHFHPERVTAASRRPASKTHTQAVTHPTTHTHQDAHRHDEDTDWKYYDIIRDRKRQPQDHHGFRHRVSTHAPQHVMDNGHAPENFHPESVVPPQS